eukprot:1159557-Pelagomonas_calceolata.AAC.11
MPRAAPQVSRAYTQSNTSGGRSSICVYLHSPIHHLQSLGFPDAKSRYTGGQSMQSQQCPVLALSARACVRLCVCNDGSHPNETEHSSLSIRSACCMLLCFHHLTLTCCLLTTNRPWPTQPGR